MKNYLLFYDTETTGIPVWNEPSEGDNQPHIVQLAAKLVDPDQDYKTLQSINLISLPFNWEIPEETTEIHGISTTLAEAIGFNESEIINIFMDLFDCAKSTIAHNKVFDQRIIRIALKRFDYPENMVETWKDHDAQCTGLLAKPIMKMEPKNTYGYKMPKLSEAYKYFTGKELVGAHDAMNDVDACIEIYKHIKQHHSD